VVLKKGEVEVEVEVEVEEVVLEVEELV